MKSQRLLYAVNHFSFSVPYKLFPEMGLVYTEKVKVLGYYGRRDEI